MEERVCKRCLLWELSEHAFDQIYEYIQSIPGDQRAGEPEYQSRLAVCGTCDALLNGMCRECGCFVEVRAAKKRMSCPVKKWEAQGNH